jgi:hypothetical protein
LQLVEVTCAPPIQRGYFSSSAADASAAGQSAATSMHVKSAAKSLILLFINMTPFVMRHSETPTNMTAGIYVLILYVLCHKLNNNYFLYVREKHNPHL